MEEQGYVHRAFSSKKMIFQGSELQLTTNLAGVVKISQISLVGKVISNKIITKKSVQMIISRVWFT